MTEITFPDNSKKKYPKGVTGLDILKDMPQKVRHEALAMKLNGVLTDLTTPIDKNAKLKFVTFEDKDGVEIFRHSSAHLMAQAITELFPYAKLTIGPVVDEGFYYDVDHEPFNPEDLEKIEQKMKEIVEMKVPIEKTVLTRKRAKELFRDNPYKLELINEMKAGETITAYQQGEFVDLCRGPHLPNTSYIKAFKLMKIAGAYWRGDIKNKQLQRVYGISFPDKKELSQYLFILEEAKKRDHRMLGKKLDLFSFHEEGVGFPFFHAKGMIIWNELLRFWREEHAKAGYVEISTPTMLSKKLWEQSGHWENYKENMYTTTIDNEEFAIKPMNCPGGLLVFKEKLHSYKELPLRIGEIGHVHRHELSGVVTGLFRVRAFWQDDAHIYCTEEQLKSEIKKMFELYNFFYKTFGLDYHIELSTRPEKFIGDIKNWDFSEKVMGDFLKEEKIKHEVNEGDGAFYGPKFDFHIKDAIGRTWQCGTIQVDMNLPERFDITYEGKDGSKHRPIMLHRALYGGVERFYGILIEHFAGKFPLWLAPEQVRILTVSDTFNDYAEKVKKLFKDAGIRAEIEQRTESISKKVRIAQVEYIPLILTVGEKEVTAGTVAVRTLDGQVKFGIKTEDFVKKVKENIVERKLKFEF